MGDADDFQTNILQRKERALLKKDHCGKGSIKLKTLPPLHG